METYHHSWILSLDKTIELKSDKWTQRLVGTEGEICSVRHGWHLAFLYGLPDIKWFGLFLAFLNVEENSIFYSLFWINVSKYIAIFYTILTFELCHFNKILRIFVGLFIHFWGFGLFLKLLMAKFGLLKFLWTWQPCCKG